MVSRHIVTPSGQDDVPPHDHDATEISGVFNFLRVLKLLVGGAGSATSQLFVDTVLQHLNLRETDDANYPNKVFIVDVNGGLGRLFWADSTSGSSVFTSAIEIHQDGTVDIVNGPLIVESGTASAPTIHPDGAATTGIFFDTGAFGIAIGGSEVARATSSGWENTAGVQDVIRGRASDNSGGTISTSEAVKATASLTIPSNWNTYDIDAFCHVRVYESGTFTATRGVNGFLRLGGLGGSVLGDTTSSLDNGVAGGDFEDATINGFLTGESTTGSISVTYSNVLSGDSGQASWNDLRLIVYAWRTS